MKYLAAFLTLTLAIACGVYLGFQLGAPQPQPPRDHWEKIGEKTCMILADGGRDGCWVPIPEHRVALSQGHAVGASPYRQ
jgi:hypothetical protein